MNAEQEDDQAIKDELCDLRTVSEKGERFYLSDSSVNAVYASRPQTQIMISEIMIPTGSPRNEAAIAPRTEPAHKKAKTMPIIVGLRDELSFEVGLSSSSDFGVEQTGHARNVPAY